MAVKSPTLLVILSIIFPPESPKRALWVGGVCYLAETQKVKTFRLAEFHAQKLSGQSGKFPHLFTLQLMFRQHFMGNFVNMLKNFPDAQKLSGWQCHRANDVFGTLPGT